VAVVTIAVVIASVLTKHQEVERERAERLAANAP